MNAPRSDKAARWEQLSSRWVKHLGEFKTARTARDAMQQGAELLMLKEASPYGTWKDRANSLGLDAKTAQRLMAVARRFESAPKAFFDAVGTVTKLFELLSLDSDLCDLLMQGEGVHGLTLETIAAMSTQELRGEVREANAVFAGVSIRRAPAQNLPWPGQLTVDEERMLRLFRQCDAKTREALFLVAELQARS